MHFHKKLTAVKSLMIGFTLTFSAGIVFAFQYLHEYRIDVAMLTAFFLGLADGII